VTIELIAGKTILEGKVRPALRIQEVIVRINSISVITTIIGDICITDTTTGITDTCIQGFIKDTTGICIPGFTIDIKDICTPCVIIGITGTEIIRPYL
jgi:hypothetical protein